MGRRERLAGELTPAWKLALIVLPILAGLLSLSLGRFSVPLGDVLRALAGGDVDKQTKIVVLSIRLPRVLLALLAGMGLSTAGCAYQTLFANPLATPDTLGVASGASFGAALGLLLGLRMLGVQLSALLFGFAAVALTGLSGKGSERGTGTVVLSGIMIGSLFSALVSLVKFVADPDSQLPAITYWLMGSLSGAGYDSLLLGAPPIVLGTAVLLALRWKLNLLPLPEDEARASGVNLPLLRGVTVLCATLMTASCVSMCGQVGWVGLLVP
ncbi:MAG: iron ABC transporter permease, partial [Eubacteriales bacterium]|nr:iron ABC transporter permease [Eubacteriales bacterium]